MILPAQKRTHPLLGIIEMRGELVLQRLMLRSARAGSAWRCA